MPDKIIMGKQYDDKSKELDIRQTAIETFSKSFIKKEDELITIISNCELGNVETFVNNRQEMDFHIEAEFENEWYFRIYLIGVKNGRLARKTFK